MAVASDFLIIASRFAQQLSPEALALSAQQADFAPSQVLASSACKAGMKAKAASVKQRVIFFIFSFFAYCGLRAVNPCIYTKSDGFVNQSFNKFPGEG